MNDIIANCVQNQVAHGMELQFPHDVGAPDYIHLSNHLLEDFGFGEGFRAETHRVSACERHIVIDRGK